MSLKWQRTARNPAAQEPGSPESRAWILSPQEKGLIMADGLQHSCIKSPQMLHHYLLVEKIRNYRNVSGIGGGN